MPANRLSAAAVLDGIKRRLLRPQTRRAIIACAQAGYGAARNLRGILATAHEFGATPRAVAAALGFLPDARNPRRYVDVLTADECDIALLPKDTEIAAAFALSRAACPEGGSFVAE